MALSKQKKKELRALYETWGVDAVRWDLERNNHPMLVSPDVIAFARAWVRSQEAKGPRRTKIAAAFFVFSLSLLAGTIAAMLAL